MKRQHVVQVGVFIVLGVLASCSPDAKKSRYLGRADGFYSQKKYPEAVIEYMNVLRLDSSNHLAIERIGLAHFAQGNFQEAFPFLAKAAALEPGHADVGTKLAQVYLLSGNLKEARDAADRVMQVDPTNFEALMIWSSASLTREWIDEDLARMKGAEPQFGAQARYHIALGNLNLRTGNRTAAETDLKKAVELDPKLADAQTALADLYMSNGDTKAAGEHYQAAMELAPIDSQARLKWSGYKVQTGEPKEAKRILDEMTQQVPGYMPAWYGLAEFAFAEKKYDECLLLVDKVLKKEPRHMQALVLRSKARLAKGEVDRAIDDFEGLISSYPKYAPLHYHLALALARKGTTVRAIDEFGRALALQPDFLDAGFAMAELEIRTGKSDAAIDYLQKLVKENPNLARAYVMLGTAYREHGMPDRAAAAYNKLIELQPRNPQGSYMLGLVLRKQGKRPEARAAFEKAIEASPEFVFPVATLASMDVEDKDFDGALALINQHLEKQPDVPELHYLQGKVYLVKGDNDHAEQAMLKAIEIQPRISAAYIDLARIYAAGGRRDQALKKMEEALVVNSNNVAALMLAGLFYQEGSDMPKAQANYEHILRINPKFAPAANNLAWIYSEKLGDWDRANEMAKEARENAPRDPYIADTLGWIACHRGDFKTAASLLQESADQLPDEPEVQYHFAAAAVALGDEASARDALLHALAKPGDFDDRIAASNLLAVLSIDAETASPADEPVLQEAVTKDPKCASALVRLGLISQRSGDSAKAQDYFEDALKAVPTYVPALAHLAEFYADVVGDKAMALELAKKARELVPSDPHVTETLGWVAFQSGDYVWAGSLLGDMAVQLPDDATAQYRAGRASYAMGNVDDAEKAVRRALQISETFKEADDATLFIRMLDLAKIAGSTVDALAQADAVLKDHSGYVPAMVARAAALDGARSPTGARETYGKILALYPDFAPAISRLAELYAESRISDDAAFKVAQRARELQPEDAAVAGALGTIAYLRGQHDRAADLLQESAGKDGTVADVYFYLGMARYAQKNVIDAKKALSRALEIDPSFRYADEAKKTLAVVQ